MITTRKIKQLVSASKILSFISFKYDLKTDGVVHNEYFPHKNIQNLSLHPMNDPLIVNSPRKKYKYIVGLISFSSICSVMLLILLLIGGLWLVKVIVDVDVY